MMKKINFVIFGLCVMLAVNGCATGRNYQADLDALNAKISALQGEISSRDEELTHLRSQVSQSEASQREALAQAESENRKLNEKLNIQAKTINELKGLESQAIETIESNKPKSSKK